MPVCRFSRLAYLVGLFALAGCGLNDSYWEERDLLTARCTLVERMQTFTSFISDVGFEVGVRCDGDRKDYVAILSASESGEYGLSSTAAERKVGKVTVYACRVDEWGGRDAVRGTLDRLNGMSDRTGLSFTLSPVAEDCERHFPPPEDMLTNPVSKSFQRRLAKD